jgi:hypothetical protein
VSIYNVKPPDPHSKEKGGKDGRRRERRERKGKRGGIPK